MPKRNKYPQGVDKEARKWRIRPLTARNENQKSYLRAIDEATISLCSGPAGTGKTYLATWMACKMLLDGDIKKIIITRPILEAGENLGFLPGDLAAKVHPYLLPLLDAFEDHIGVKMTKDFLEKGIIEIAPLAYMRGRTFNNSFAILDEGQNASKTQVKLFLTRLGRDSKYVINGDATQSDLEEQSRVPLENGLSWAIRKLTGVNSNIYVESFTKKDIVRHPLIADILTHLESPDIPKKEKSQVLLEQSNQ